MAGAAGLHRTAMTLLQRLLLGVGVAALLVHRAAAQVCTGSFTAAHTMGTGLGVIRALEHIPSSDDLLVAGGEDQMLRVWKLNPFSATVHNTLAGHTDAIFGLTWVDTHSLLASCSGDGTIRFWPTSVLSNAQTCSNTANCCDGDGLGCDGSYVVSWRDFYPMTRKYQVHAVLWVSSVSRLATAWEDQKVRLWSWSVNKFVAAETITSTDRIHDLAWLAAGSFLATASPDEKQPRLWGTITGTPVENVLSKDRGLGGFGLCPYSHCGAVLGVATDTAGNTLATASMDNSVILWNPSTKQKLSQYTSHTGYVASVVWMDSESKIASGSNDNSVKIWDASNTATSHTSSSETLTGHTGQVNALVWMSTYADGQLASGSADGTVRLWDCN